MDIKKAIPYEPIWMLAHEPDEDDDEDYLDENESPYDAYWNYEPMGVYDPE